jgi:hypothetical protein
MDSNLEIKNFEFYEGFIKIGDHIIPLKKEEISIRIDANEWLNDIYWIINGKWEYLNFDKQIITEDIIENSINYMFRFSKGNITNREIKIIINEYNKNNKKTDIYLKYGLLLNNELIINEIYEEHTIEIKTQNWNLFTAALMWILMGGRH